MKRTDKALAELIEAIKGGAEFPDVANDIAARHRVSYEALRDAYDALEDILG